MATIDITQQSFAQTLEDNGIVFVDFWAAWCGPCHMFAPTYPQAFRTVTADELALVPRTCPTPPST